MNFLGLISIFVVLTIYFTLFKTGRATSIVIEDVNKNASLMNCSLSFISEKEQRLFNITIKKNRLIKLSMKLTWTDIPQNVSQNNIHFDITKSTWFLATEDAGKDLLLLDDQFEVMSLRTLAISVGAVALTLNQMPEDCLAELSNHQAIETISGFLLKSVLPEIVNDVKYEDQADTIYACNGTITGYGLCCLLNGPGIITCLKLEQNEWTRQFVNFVIILSLFILSQSTRLIPKSFYQERYVEKRDVQTPIKLNIEMKVRPTYRGLVNISGKDNYKNLKKNCPAGKQVSILSVYLFLDDARFESQASNNSALSTVFRDVVQMCNDIFCKCNEDYSDFEGIKECCYYDLIYMCYKYFTRIIVVLLFFTPLAIRLLFLYTFVDTYLKPRLQLILILIIYCSSVAILTFLLFSIRCLRNLKSIYIKKLKQSIDQAMAYNINTGLEKAGEMIKTFFIASNSICYRYRFSRLSLVKAWLTIVIISFPLSIIRLCLQINMAVFPPSNFLARSFVGLKDLFQNLLRDEFQCPSVCLIIIAFFIMLIILHSIICALMFLFTEVAVFFAKCCLYITIGCLLNFDNLLVYFSFCILISTYIVQCIREVNIKVRNFNKEIIQVLSKIPVEGQNTLNGLIVVKRNGIFFSTSQLSYFVKKNEHDRVEYLYVSRSFLNYLSSIPSPLTPGSRNWLYCKAFMKIVLMFLLLMLVVVIVVSYGNATDLSTGMKTLITLGSGALLFFFNILLIRSCSHSTNEDDALLEKFIKSHVKDDFKEIWEVNDFDNFSADNTENNANLYFKYKNEHEIQFFTKESLITTRNAETVSFCEICCLTVCTNCHETNNNETNNNRISNQVYPAFERL